MARRRGRVRGRHEERDVDAICLRSGRVDEWANLGEREPRRGQEVARGVSLRDEVKAACENVHRPRDDHEEAQETRLLP